MFLYPLYLLYPYMITFDVLLANLRHASTNWCKANKNKNLIKFSCGLFVVILMYIILLNKLRFDQISYSGRRGTRGQYGVPKWYEIVKILGIAAL